jgi:hypothetical protein
MANSIKLRNYIKGAGVYMKEYKFALVGATGLVGRTAIQVMEEMKLPFSKIVFFASERSAGKTITFEALENFKVVNGKIVESWGSWPDKGIEIKLLANETN